MIHLDGTMGEGGGQVLRSSLSLSLLTGQPFHIDRIRGGRRKAGLLRQHLTAVRAACEISGGQAVGAEIRSDTLTFTPGTVQAGEYHFAIGTAGSTSLVLQTVLLPLAMANGPSLVTIEGGTHNGKSPPTTFLQRVFLPLLARMGVKVELTLERYGFYPAGGGRIQAYIEPTERLKSLRLMSRGEIHHIGVEAVLSALPRRIANTELSVIRQRLNLHRKQGTVRTVDDPMGPGNVVWIEAQTDHLTELFSVVGEKGLPAVDVADALCDAFEAWRDGGAPVGEYLADQLLLPMAIAGSGTFLTGPLSLHSTTNMDVIRHFLDASFAVEEREDGVKVSLGGAS